MNWIESMRSSGMRGLVAGLLAAPMGAPAAFAQKITSRSMAPLRTNLTVQVTQDALRQGMPSLQSIVKRVKRLQELNPGRPVVLIVDRSLFESSPYDTAAAVAVLREADRKGVIRLLLADRAAADSDDAADRLQALNRAMSEAAGSADTGEQWVQSSAVDVTVTADQLTKATLEDVVQFPADEQPAAKPGTIHAGYTDEQIRAALAEAKEKSASLRAQFKDVVDIAVAQAASVDEAYEERIRKELKSRSVDPEQIASVIEALRQPETEFTWFQAKVEGPEQYLIGHQSALSVDFLDFLVSQARSQNERDLKSNPQAQLDYTNIAEYVLHEALERVPSLDHRSIIDATAAILGRPAVTAPGQTALGLLIRQFINMRAAETIVSMHRAADVIATSDHQRLVQDLMAMGQYQLFTQWDAAGTNDERKRQFLDQLLEMDRAYIGGLKAYRENAQKIIGDAIAGVNRLKGIRPSVPDTTVMPDMGRPEFAAKEQRGLAAANKTGFVLVAGGLGDRLGYDGLKVDIPIDLATLTEYLQYYVESILAFQAKSNAINGENRMVPLTIMTSDDTDALTRRMLAANNNFGAAEGQIRIVKQGGKVPAIDSAQADFLLKAGDPYTLQAKPHGHGDIHKLLKDAGILQDALAAEQTHTVIFQDTNAQAMNAVLSSLAVSLEKNLDVNLVSVPREAGEATGSIVRASREGQQDDTRSIEYNDLGPLLVAVAAEQLAEEALRAEDEPEMHQLAQDLQHGVFSVNKYMRPVDANRAEHTAGIASEEVAFPAPRFLGMIQRLIETGQQEIFQRWAGESYSDDEKRAELQRLWETLQPDERPLRGGDQKDPQTGLSPYPALLNVIILNNAAYAEVLDKTGGGVPEFVNPKWKDPANPLLGMKAPTRLEGMMQDLLPEFAAVGVTAYPKKRQVFSPVKNDPKSGAAKVKDGIYPDAMPTGEADFYMHQRGMLHGAGVAINVDGIEQRTVHGVPYRAGAMVVLKPRFAQTVAEVKEKFQGGSISDRSACVVNGAGVLLKNVSLDGALVVEATEGVSLTLDGLNIQNAGWRLAPLSDDALKSTDTPPYLLIRGYGIQKSEQVIIRASEPGNYTVTAADIPGPGVYEIQGGKVVRVDAPSEPLTPTAGASPAAALGAALAQSDAAAAAQALHTDGMVSSAVLAPARPGVGAAAIDQALAAAVKAVEQRAAAPVVFVGAAAEPVALPKDEDWLSLVMPEDFPAGDVGAMTERAVRSLRASETSN